MIVLLALAVGVLYAGGIYMMLRRSLVKLVIGLALLSHAANLLIFTVTGIQGAHPPLLPKDGTLPAASVADPLPQALILTAIVISFGVLAFALTLVHRTYATSDTDDVDRIGSAER
jgi:multicomponent Na+:H+ antiporter subunit C